MAWVNGSEGILKRSGYFYEGKEISLAKRKGWNGVMTKSRAENMPGKHVVHKRDFWPEKIKIECAALYAVVRDFNKVNFLQKVPVSRLKMWAQEPWWDEVMRKVTREKNEELDGKLTDVLHKAVDLVVDRLENGDLYPDGKDEEGKQKYKRIPLKSRDLTNAFDVMFNKRQLLRGEATTRTETVSEEKKLQTLKENFEKLAKSKGINPESEPIEGEINAIETGEGQESNFSEYQDGNETR